MAETDSDGALAFLGLTGERELAVDDALRRLRSAWLLVGSTPLSSLKVHSAGQSLGRLLAKVQVCLWLARLRA